VKKLWGPMVEKYLATRPNLMLSILITDSRHEPTNLDLQMREWLEARGKPLIIVATKADKLSSNQLRSNLNRASMVLGKSEIIAYSAVTRRGRDRIWKEIHNRIADCGFGEPIKGGSAN
jgi:GTP-binding protein